MREFDTNRDGVLDKAETHSAHDRLWYITHPLLSHDDDDDDDDDDSLRARSALVHDSPARVPSLSHDEDDGAR